MQLGQDPQRSTLIGQPSALSGLPVDTWTEVPGNQSGWFFCRYCDVSVATAAALSQASHMLSSSSDISFLELSPACNSISI